MFEQLYDYDHKFKTDCYIVGENSRAYFQDDGTTYTLRIEVVRIDVQLAITLKWGHDDRFVRSDVQAMLDNTTPTTSPSMHVDT